MGLVVSDYLIDYERFADERTTSRQHCRVRADALHASSSFLAELIYPDGCSLAPLGETTFEHPLL
jgi:hypothetical protein